MSGTEKTAWVIVSGLTTTALCFAAMWLIRESGGPQWAETLALIVVLMGSLVMWRK
jgi:hypothetical protein